MRTDNNPIGMMIEQFQNLAYHAHPYHHSTIGYMSDINNITRQECEEFYRRNYVGERMTVAVVGDVEFDKVQRLAKKFFSGISGAKAPRVETVEPAQLGERRQILKHSSQPMYASGFHIGSINHPDYPVFEAIADIMGQGRTSRLYKTLVKDQKLAVQAVTFCGFPGNKYPSQIIFLGIPAKDVTALEIEEVIFAEIEKLKNEGVTAEELAGVKRRAKAGFIRSLEGNRGLAVQLCHFQAKTGDWRNTFGQVEAIDAVTQADIKRVANEILTDANRTVVYIETVEEES